LPSLFLHLKCPHPHNCSFDRRVLSSEI
jgi:hypothetical protein